MEQDPGFVRLQAVPDPLGHKERVPGLESNARPGNHLLVAVVEDQIHRAAEQVEQLVAAGMPPRMRPRTYTDRDHSNRVAIDASRSARW